MGRAGGGKSHLLEVIAGETKPHAGSIQCEVDQHFCGDPVFPRRATPLSLAKKALDTENTQRIVVVLNALGLTDLRDVAVTKLTQSQMIACALIDSLMPEQGLAIIDGLLDLLDPWTLEAVFQVIQTDLELGKSYVLATHQPAFAERCDQLIVVRDQNMIFAGSIPQLIAETAPAQFTVDCEDQSTVAAMVEPFALNIKKSPGKIIFTTHRNQSLAAKLLTHGYGNISAISVSEPTLRDALKILKY
jgi:ABC-type multidrug transport system ATPase subunit